MRSACVVKHGTAARRFENLSASMKLTHWLYYAFNRWRYGESYGCGRCHHSVELHFKFAGCESKGCPCREYSTERVRY